MMSNHDVDAASSEPNSIAPMALDVGRWEIDLRNLRSGERMDFSIPHFEEEEDVGHDSHVALSGEVPAVLPRRSPVARRVFGAMTAMLLVAGLGFAAFRGRTTLQRTFANASARTRLAQTSTPVTVAAPPPPVAAAPPPNASVVVPPAPPPAPVVAADAPPALPTLSASQLPNAKGGKAKPAKHGKRTK